MTRNLPKILGAVAFVGAMTIGTAAPSMAQGVYFQGPGVEIGVGPRERPFFLPELSLRILAHAPIPADHGGFSVCSIFHPASACRSGHRKRLYFSSAAGDAISQLERPRDRP